MREPETGEMLDRSFGGVTSALLASRRSSTIAYIRGRTTSSTLAGYARDFLPTARPSLFLRAPSSRFIRPRLVREPAFQTLPGVTTLDASWLGFVNQKSTAPAELSRFFGERNGRKPHRITAIRPPGVACDVIPATNSRQRNAVAHLHSERDKRTHLGSMPRR